MKSYKVTVLICVLVVMAAIITACGGGASAKKAEPKDTNPSALLTDTQDTTGQDFIYPEIGREEYDICSGVKEATIYFASPDSNTIRTNILKINKDAPVNLVSSLPNYYEQDDKLFTTVERQVQVYEKYHKDQGRVLAASNGDFFDSDGSTLGNLIIDGDVVKNSYTEPFFGVTFDGDYVIRDTGGSIDDLKEAIGGNIMLVRDGEVVYTEDEAKEPRQVIGLTGDGDVLIVSLNGREPNSPGATLEEASQIMLQLGCTAAINFDGGGSVSLMTMREGESELKYRNMLSDGIDRRVSSSLLIVDRDSAKAEEQEVSIADMREDESAISEKSGEYEYSVNGEPRSGIVCVNDEMYLFDENGKGMDESIELAGKTYNFKGGRLEDQEDITLGYCGASETGDNLIFAYNKKEESLDIGVNPMSKSGGEMEDWEAIRDVPWCGLRYEINSVTVDEGVENIGSNFITTSLVAPFAARDIESQLTEVTLPDSLKKIGDKAFFGTVNLKEVNWDNNAETIGDGAFGHSGFTQK